MTLVSTDSNVAVFSRGATAVDLCLFDDAGRETRRIRLPARTGPVWHGRVSGLREGQRYGLRITGPEAQGPADCFDPAKLLIDPYARHLTGGLVETAALSRKGADTADAVPLGVVTASLPPADRPARPMHPWPETVIYEAHLRGLTMAMPGIPESTAGTWEALAHPDLIAHLQGLGVTAIELLPVQAIRHHGFLRERGLSNYWGYGSLAFFAPEPQYLGPAGEAGIHAAIDALHAAGIEVLLDVVFNHTGEGDAEAPALSFRGIDNASYYLHDPSAPGRYIDHTGCGNSLDLTEPFVLRLVLDALRHWAGHYNVDGFRFDLMTTLARGPGGYDRAGGFLSALRQDPLLADRKLIAEPWDLGPGGYQLGNFPAGITEWNDRYRDDVRRFWRGDAHAAPALATRLMGSAEVFDHETRPPWSSVNFVTAHDGFTLADLTAYGAKRNEANGEENRDGRDENYSDPIGGEGPDDTVDDAARARRNLRRRNLLATLLLSQGTPMLLAGDELANSQGGNNNAYAQDNETGWLSWDGADHEMATFVSRLTALRRRYSALRQPRYLHGATRPDGRPDVTWRGLTGGRPAWDNPALPGFAVVLRGAAGERVLPDPEEVLIAINRADGQHRLSLPRAPVGRRWLRVLDTAAPTAEAQRPGRHPILAAESLALFALNATERAS